jgi:RNA polymerase sigma-32 factor
MDRMNSIATFVEIAEVGGFGAAARKLAVSPSAVTKQIQDLEDQLGVRLGRNLKQEAAMAYRSVAPILTLETSFALYIEEIKRFPMLEPQEEFILAKRWREHGDRDAAHKLITSHLRLVAKVATSYRGYGLPISEVVSEGNVGLLRAVRRFDPERGFRLATYAIWWIKAAIQEYTLHSWSLVKMGTTVNQKKLFFNLRKAKARLSAFDQGDMRPDQVEQIATELGVTEQDVVEMNRWLGGDASLNAPIRENGNSAEWQDWLVDESASQESRLAESDQSETRQKALGQALTVLNDRERIRQIEVRAFEKVRKAATSAISSREPPKTTSMSAVA